MQPGKAGEAGRDMLVPRRLDSGPFVYSSPSAPTPRVLAGPPCPYHRLPSQLTPPVSIPGPRNSYKESKDAELALP